MQPLPMTLRAPLLCLNLLRKTLLSSEDMKLPWTSHYSLVSYSEISKESEDDGARRHTRCWRCFLISAATLSVLVLATIFNLVILGMSLWLNWWRFGANYGRNALLKQTSFFCKWHSIFPGERVF